MSDRDTSEFVIAALGASAGGLEALEIFFTHMPADSGIAFVVVQHLAPDHPSALANLLSRRTGMAVEQARDNLKVVPNRVYIIPPGTTLTIRNGTLQVTPPTEPRGRRMPIDNLFGSLAEECGENAVCILLSGTGTDGTVGLKAIKEYGGMAMAQTLETAKYDAILRSAIATGLVDHVLPVEEMPANLLEYAAHLNTTNGKIIRELIDPTLLRKIHTLLRRRAGHDFSQYKEATILRRLQRRMKALQIETAEQYLQALDQQPEEANRLFKDLLIGVTQFFRDADAFAALSREVIPHLFEGKSGSSQVRTCVVGCASGEEAYSIAILLQEHATMLDNPPELKIFATDIDEQSLEIARNGRYPESIAEHVSPERLERFFTIQGAAYQVKRELREICLFTHHSFIKDPPFSRLDLISCRNVMIYLGADLQRKIVPLFHYALRPGGYLFLGPSEDVLNQRDLFQTVDKKHRIFHKKETPSHRVTPYPLADIGVSRQTVAKQFGAEEAALPRRLERVILERYRPACVAVHENGEAVYFSGGIGRFLEPATGSPDNNIINMAREELRIPLRTALHKAVTSHQRVIQKQVSIQTNGGGASLFDLIVEPIAEINDANLYMIAVEDAKPVAAGAAEPNIIDAGSAEAIRHLEDELRSAREQAQAMFEELESANEELRSANEEYQSTNEELETSKEEVQSFNEELETVNAELNRRVAELDHSNSDLQNLNNSTQIATIFLSADWRIKSFTQAAANVFRLIPGDIGRPISDLAVQFAEGSFVDDIKEVLRTLELRERDLSGPQGHRYLMRILPYRTVHDVIEGVVVTFTDITQLTQAEQIIHDAKAFAENVVDMVREPLLVLDSDLRVKSANQSFFKSFNLEAKETLNQYLYEVGDRQWDIPDLRRLLSEILPEKKRMEDFEVDTDFVNVGRTTMLLNAREIPQQKGAARLILLVFEDITARSRAEAALRAANRDLRYFAYAASHDLQEPLRMVTSYTQLLAKRYEGTVDQLGERFIGYAIEGAHRMETLLNGMREYWAVDETVAENVVADSEQSLREALAYLEAQIADKGASVTHDQLPAVAAEEPLLTLVFKNLISNSLKYVRPGEKPRIHVSAQRTDNTWTFSVQDNGIGIEPEHLQSIFAPFKRLHGREEYPGSGLGLAICQRIVERYGGSIWADSEFGWSSKFHFTVPAEGHKV